MILSQAILVISGRAARCTNTFSPSRREQSSGRGQSLEGPTALLTTLGPVSQTGRNRSYKGPRGYPSESCGHADEPRCVRHVSLGRVCRLTLRFPPQGPPGRVPLLHRYYQSATTSGRPSRRTSLSVLGNVKGGFLIFLGGACGALLRTRPLTVAGCNPLAYSRVR